MLPVALRDVFFCRKVIALPEKLNRSDLRSGKAIRHTLTKAGKINSVSTKLAPNK